jgi:hypothetical protein
MAMDNFWKWLKQANARAVFFCLLVALVGVTAWWAWKLMTPIQATPPIAPGISQEQARPGLGILAYLQIQQAAGTNRAANLFFPPGALIRTPPPPTPPKPVPPTPPTAQITSKPPVKPVPVKATVTLTYRGRVMRRDGVPLALIADSKGLKPVFYEAGTNLFGLKITSIEEETLGVNLADQSSTTLERGIPQTFPESKHAD